MKAMPYRRRANFLACASPRRTLHASGGGRQRASGAPSPPLEEREGERRPIPDAALRGDIPAGCRANRFGGLAENDDLLSLPLSSKGGEGNDATVSKQRDACVEQAGETDGSALRFFIGLRAPSQSQSPDQSLLDLGTRPIMCRQLWACD